MSVSSTTAEVSVTITSLPQNVNIDFQVYAVADLIAYDGGLNNTGIDPPTVLALGSDYTYVSGFGYNSQTQLQEGVVSVAAGGTGNVQIGDVITFKRNVAQTQLTSFASTGLLTPLMIEQALDKLTLLAQELYLMIGLCLQFEQNDTDATTLIKSLRENNQLGFDSLGRISYGPFGGGTSMLSITGFTGGGPTNIDGINTAWGHSLTVDPFC